jgi:hypothetical protein
VLDTNGPDLLEGDPPVLNASLTSGRIALCMLRDVLLLVDAIGLGTSGGAGVLVDSTAPNRMGGVSGSVGGTGPSTAWNVGAGAVSMGPVTL